MDERKAETDEYGVPKNMKTGGGKVILGILLGLIGIYLGSVIGVIMYPILGLDEMDILFGFALLGGGLGFIFGIIIAPNK